MIGKLRSVVIDTREPRALAAFYADLLGGSVTVDDDDWVVVTEPGGRRIACQLSHEHEPPAFPDRRGSQQFHLDIEVEDIDAAEQAVIALGAARVADAPHETDFRVFRDPAGHPFCLVFHVTD